MSKKIALIALVVICVACLFTLAACAEETPEDFVNAQGNTVKVVVDDMNGTIHDYRLKPNSLIPEPGVTKGVKEPVKADYVFQGYYLGTKDSEGNVAYGEKWDFSTKVNSEVTLFAKWDIQYVIRINFVLNGSVVSDKYDTMKVSDNADHVTSIKEPTWLNNTFVEMYSDAAMTNVLDVTRENPFVHGCTQTNPMVEVYAKFIEGRWTLVRTANDMRTISAGSRLYLLNDIDFAELNDATTGLTNITINRGTFTGAIEGNGFAIKNLHYLAKGETGTKPGATNFGLFSKVQGASFTNVTFENCSVVGEIAKESNEYFYGFLAGTAEANADGVACVFSNITLKNCQVKPIQFDAIRISASKHEQLLANVEQAIFVATGGNYVPNVIA